MIFSCKCRHVNVRYTAALLLDIDYNVVMYITAIPNRSSPPAILLRESYREDGKVKTRTLANLSKLPDEAIDLLKRHLAGPGCRRARDTFWDSKSPK